MRSMASRVKSTLRTSFKNNVILVLDKLSLFKKKISKLDETPNDSRSHKEMSSARRDVMCYGFIVEAMHEEYGQGVRVDPNKRAKPLTDRQVDEALEARAEVKRILDARATIASEKVAKRLRRRKPGGKRKASQVSSRQPKQRASRRSNHRRIYSEDS